MAVVPIFATSWAAIVKAGKKVSDQLSGGTVLIGTDNAVDVWLAEAESRINALTRYNWSDRYSALNIDTKYLLGEASSSLAAIQCITYDPSGYTGRGEAVFMANVLDAKAAQCIALLKDQEVKSFIDEA